MNMSNTTTVDGWWFHVVESSSLSSWLPTILCICAIFLFIWFFVHHHHDFADQLSSIADVQSPDQAPLNIDYPQETNRRKKKHRRILNFEFDKTWLNKRRIRRGRSVYVGGSFKYTATIERLSNLLRANGHTVFNFWTTASDKNDECALRYFSANGTNNVRDMFNMPTIAPFFAADMSGILMADTFVLVGKPGVSSSAELGVAAAMKKHCHVLFATPDAEVGVPPIPTPRKKMTADDNNYFAKLGRFDLMLAIVPGENFHMSQNALVQALAEPTDRYFDCDLFLASSSFVA